jgi:predicted AlkP superfamily pyrophosphatase or phosphodiesterase
MMRAFCIGSLFVLFLFVTQEAFAQQDTGHYFDPDDRPKLVVGIVVDQMHYEYLTRYWRHYGEDGFKRLVNQGYNFANNHFNYFPTYTGPGHAAVYSGATPSVNGIVGNSWFDRELGRNMYVVEDTSVRTVGGTGEVGQMSPANLNSNTIVDELKMVSEESKAVAVSLKDRGAVLAAGHLGDQAFWYDSETGNFVSSTWYMDELPDWVQQFNREGAAREYSNSTWETLLPLEEYTESIPDDSPYERTFDWEEKPVFPHELGKNENGNYSTLTNSPFGNTLVKDFAKRVIDNENLGQDDITDVLSISFSSTDYIGHQFGTHSVEVQDTYLRLDRDLADLLDGLDQKVGEGNYLVFLTSDHGAVDVPAQLVDKGLPGGYIDSDAVAEQLSKYLAEKYGQEQWIRALANQQIYLDRKLVREEGISLKEMQEDIAEYLLQVEGVLSTNTAQNYQYRHYSEGLQAMYQKGFNYQRSGDVFVQLKPGWLISSYRTGTTHGSPYNYDTHIPMLLYGWGVSPGVTHKKTAVTQLAPTLSVLLQIPFPSGSEANPLTFEE